MSEFLWQRQGIRRPSVDLRFGGDMRDSTATNDSVERLERQLQHFYLACCRAIWELLPDQARRNGVELAENYLAGKASGEELSAFNWSVEGAAFNIDYEIYPKEIACWVEQVRAIPEAELRCMLHPPGIALEIEPRELLQRAAYFVDFAMIYPSLTPKGPPLKSYYPFLSAELLREFVE